MTPASKPAIAATTTRRPSTIARVGARSAWPWPVSTFEKVIAANSIIIVLATLAGWWITQHNPETYHYLIDTTFIALAATLGLVVNFLALRAAFAPLRDLLATMRAVERGDLEARLRARESDRDVLMIARAFNAMLDQLAHARDGVAARVLRAQEAERRHLALELHDQTGQSLTALTLHAEAIAQRLARETSPAATQARAQAERLAGLAQRTLAEVQTLSRHLRPPVLDDLGLEAALRWLADDACERLGVTVAVRVRGVDGVDGVHDIDGESSVDAPSGSAQIARSDGDTALYRVAQEGITNAVRHGHARHIVVSLRESPAWIWLTVADDGEGFVPRNLPATGADQRRGGGTGLEGMRERMRLLGGTLVVRSRPGHGTAVRAVLPWPALAAVLGVATAAGVAIPVPGEARR
ncbi:MAG TPA: sensor histidine kinase [Ktedonobacterales bacterium]